eukprot:CAMPEP_0119124774 /NCGR_PEP_ID=MMETSP1310-20130426/4291_1 /TAXON_ID=464262 /ORGANISM="Genus nov. species nov., Strain RCC2339" /LENGTH=238 /DNA_ID=CAMNT_0007114775 /DNA_START=516 /DNA_END=1229 /DNA_ORIENTATION=+
MAYMGMFIGGLMALQHTNIMMYNSLRRTGLVFVLIIQYMVIGAVPSRQALLAVGIITTGTGLAAAYDLSFDSTGYEWAILCNVTYALYVVLIRWVTEKTGFDAVGIIFYNSTLCLPFTMILLAIAGVESDIYSRSVSFWVAFGASSVMGFFINHAIMYNTTVNSPMTHSVTGQLKDVILILLSFQTDYTFSLFNFVGVLSSFLGSMVYAHAKLQEAKEATNDVDENSDLGRKEPREEN